MVFSFQRTINSLWARDKFAYSIRVFIALSGILLGCWLTDNTDQVMSLFLGAISSAIAETDDHWRGRLRAVIVTLISFLCVSVLVQWLFQDKLIFIVMLCSGAFVLTMLGAIGERYAAIAQASLILSIYAMIGVMLNDENSVHDFWEVPMLLVGGAAWYGLLSVLWSALFVNQPVQQSLSLLFVELGTFLQIKSQLLEPTEQVDIEDRRLQLARQNSRVVTALNHTRDLLFNRIRRNRSGIKINRYLRLYFIAQDIHERATSTHYPYASLASTFFFSDVLFRCQRLLNQQGAACKALGRAVRYRHGFNYQESQIALDELNRSMEHLREQENPRWHVLLRALQALVNNLTVLEKDLDNSHNPDARSDLADVSFVDRSPRTIREALERVKQNLTTKSQTFRHAIRLTLVLAVSYGLMEWLPLKQGYWILMTAVFVCRPNYGATKKRLGQRIVGTVIGLFGSWALITLFPNLLVQSLLILVFGVIFFIYRVDRYLFSTAAITVVLMLCFNEQIGGSLDLLLPRLYSTIIGASISALAVLFIYPDWQGRNLRELMAATLRAQGEYLQRIVEQFGQGRDDHLAYRLARRNAHNADAALTNALSNMLDEPEHARTEVKPGLRFLSASHEMLGYLSALGAQREDSQTQVCSSLTPEYQANVLQLAQDMIEASRFLKNRQLVPNEGFWTERYEEISARGDESTTHTQLAMIVQQWMTLKQRLNEYLNAYAVKLANERSE